MRRSVKRFGVVGTIVTIVTLGATGIAFADVGLPYTFHVYGLSGPGANLSTPTFWTNSTGEICVKPDLYVSRHADAGAVYDDDRYTTQLVQNPSTVILTANWTTNGDNYEYCRYGLPPNTGFHVVINKTKFISGQTLDGSGVISYS